jgi:parvulin-like peptidyl-prolyl isomerase
MRAAQLTAHRAGARRRDDERLDKTARDHASKGQDPDMTRVRHSGSSFAFDAAQGALFAAVMALGLVAAVPAVAQTAAPAPQAPFSPAAFVNDQVITAYDIDQQARLMGMLEIGDSRQAALSNAIEDRLKRSAAIDAGIGADRAQIDASLGRFAQSRGTDPEGIDKMLRASGVSRITLRNFIETEVLWSTYVRRTFLTRAAVSDLELQDELANSQRTVQTTFDLSEISLPFGRDKIAAQELAARLSREINQGGDVAALARKHSRSPTGAKGGRVEPLASDRMPPAVRAALAPLQPGQASAPIEVPGGIVVLILNSRDDKRVELDAEGRERLRQQMLEERLTRLADGRLAELRARAFIDERR